jgi:uncharacterized membrane protein YphA (DoxX/SURF4 family)
MFALAVVLSVALGCMALLSGMMKLRGESRVVVPITALGVPRSWFPFLGIVLVAGGVGVLIGLAIDVLGIAAAIGLTVYFAGAVITHLRAGDTAGVLRPLPLLVLSLAVLVTRSLSA